MLFLWGSTSDDRGEQNLRARRNAPQHRSKTGHKGGNVDNVFLKRIKSLLKVVFPSWTCKESKYVVILTLLLVLRTQMSIWLADVNGKIVKAIVERDFSKFCYRVSHGCEFLYFEY